MAADDARKLAVALYRLSTDADSPPQVRAAAMRQLEGLAGGTTTSAAVLDGRLKRLERLRPNTNQWTGRRGYVDPADDT